LLLSHEPLVYPNLTSNSSFHCRNYTRFKGYKQANTGIDPLGTIREFIAKDVVQNIDIHRDMARRVDDLNSRKDYPAIGTTMKVAGGRIVGEKPLSLEGTEASRVVRLKTDHISFNPPASTQRFQNVYDKLLTKSPYSGNFESQQGWKEMSGYKTVNNKSSVTYNILTNDTNSWSGAEILRTLDKKVTNRKKGIAEFCDLAHVGARKVNQGHHEALASDPKVFYRKLGIFSNTYDAAVRNGNPNGPFRKVK